MLATSTAQALPQGPLNRPNPNRQALVRPATSRDHQSRKKVLGTQKLPVHLHALKRTALDGSLEHCVEPHLGASKARVNLSGSDCDELAHVGLRKQLKCGTHGGFAVEHPEPPEPNH